MRRLLTVVLVLLVAAGCAQPGGSQGPGAIQPDTRDRELQQAHDALDRWAQAVEAAGGDQVFIPVLDGTRVIDGFATDEQKLAFVAGRLEAVGLDQAGPTPGEVTWPDGRSVAVTVGGPMQVVQQMVTEGDGSCDECAPLRIVSAEPITMEIQTTRGVATAPGWRFGLEGLPTLLEHVAVIDPPGVRPVPPPWDAVNPPAGYSIEDAVVSADGLTLRVGLTGSRAGADQVCGQDYLAEAVESDLAVVVIITVISNQPTGRDVACNLIGYRRTTTVTLDQPLGDRAVLEVREGWPVPVTRESA